MSVQVKPNCYCDQCDKPVAGQKRTHRFRNVGATLAIPATVGISGFLYRKGVWHCPTCGSSAVRDLEEEARAEQMAAFAAKYPYAKWVALATLLIIVAITGG